MIVENILGNLNGQPVDVPVDYVRLDWFEAEKKRLRKTTDSGVEVGIAVDRPLKDGDILYRDSHTCIAVKLTTCELLKIPVSSMQEMGRLCFEIGNRHLSLKIGEQAVWIPLDTPTEEHLTRLGFRCERVVDRFDGFVVCKAHGHTHHHGDH